MLAFAWTLFLLEIFGAVFFSLVFWHFWSHSAMKRAVALRALVVYALGCAVCILFAFFAPL